MFLKKYQKISQDGLEDCLHNIYPLMAAYLQTDLLRFRFNELQGCSVKSRIKLFQRQQNK